MMDNERKDNRAKSIITEAASTFIASESNHQSLITVTNVLLGDRGAKANILVSILPDEGAEGAVLFLKRKRGIFRDYLKTHTRLPRIPHVDFNIDYGEKNRQNVDNALRTEGTEK